MANVAPAFAEFSSGMQQMLATIRQRGITEARVLAAMGQVPRHCFIPHRYRQRAYEDGPVPIGAGQTISQPYMVAFMTAAAHLQPLDRVLEVGTGSGYQTAVLAHMGAEVYSIEIIAHLARHAEHRLQALRLSQVHLRTGDAIAGWPEAAPFAAILVTAAAPHIPESLSEQVAVGGRLVIPVGAADGHQSLQVWERTESEFSLLQSLPVRFVPMVGAVLRAPI